MKAAGSLYHLDARDREKPARPLRTLPAGIPALNDLLPGGGWPGTGLVEVITTREYAAAMALFLPLLSRFGRQNRWLAMVTPPYPPRHRLYTDPGINPERVLQVNPHPGRSGLWTVESLLRSGTCSTVMAWPCCTTELMGKRLQRAAAIGRTLGILFRQEWQSRPTSGVDVRLRLETGAHGQVLYLLDACGDVLAGTTLDFPQGSNIV